MKECSIDYLVNLRNQAKKYKNIDIDELTEGLINYPTAIKFKTVDRSSNLVTRTLVKEGFGAFGERENDYEYFIYDNIKSKKFDYNSYTLVGFDIENNYAGVIQCNVEKLLTLLSDEIDKEAERQKSILITEDWK